MSHLVPCPGCDRHVRVDEMVCPFCATALPPELRAAPPPPPLRNRLGRAALLAAGATLMGAAACSDGDGNTDAAVDRGAVTDGLAEGAVTGSGGTSGAGGTSGSDAAAGGAGGGTTNDAGNERGVMALYGIPAPMDGGIPIYGSPSPNTNPRT